MHRGQPRHAWKPWRDTIIAVVAVIAIGALASASPSLRAPRGPHESLLTIPTGASRLTGGTGRELEPAEEGESSSDAADFSSCEGMTGLDNAICRHEALLVVHPDNHGLQNSLTHLQENKASHEANAGEEDGGNVPPGDASSSSSSHGQGHGRSGESHAGGNGKGNDKDN